MASTSEAHPYCTHPQAILYETMLDDCCCDTDADASGVLYSSPRCVELSALHCGSLNLVCKRPQTDSTWSIVGVLTAQSCTSQLTLVSVSHSLDLDQIILGLHTWTKSIRRYINLTRSAGNTNSKKLHKPDATGMAPVAAPAQTCHFNSSSSQHAAHQLFDSTL